LAVTSYRLNRLFHPSSGRVLDVAVDHGFFGEPSFLTGIEDMTRTVRTLVGARPDAIQLTPGLARLLQSLPQRDKPALVLRVDVANVYGTPLDGYLFSRHFPDAIDQAVRLDAVCVVANLLQLPGRPDIRERCIESVMALRSDATRAGMPLMIEPLVMQANTAGGYMVDGDVTKIVSLVRQARELGADVIKADPTTDLAQYHRVIEAAGDVPVLVRGGGRTTDLQLLQRTHVVLSEGARGIVYGRNIVQHANPAGITAALLGILHGGLNPSQAARAIGVSA
jgi:class I fructose-bisphosphate aldolase